MSGQAHVSPIASSKAWPRSSWIMWVDGVGGFFVCRGPTAWIGRAVVEPRVEIPLAGDVQRRHVKIAWRSGRHHLEPTTAVWVNGQESSESILLNHGDLVRLVDGVDMKYLQPPLLGDTAKLEWLRPVRTVPWSDGVVLLGKTLILGRSPAAHIVCRDMRRPLVLVHLAGALYVQTRRPIEVDGQRVSGWHPLGNRSRIVCDDTAVSFEPHEW